MVGRGTKVASAFAIPSFLTVERIAGGHVVIMEVGASKRKKNGSEMRLAWGRSSCQVLHGSLATSFVNTPSRVNSSWWTVCKLELSYSNVFSKSNQLKIMVVYNKELTYK